MRTLELTASHSEAWVASELGAVLWETLSLTCGVTTDSPAGQCENSTAVHRVGAGWGGGGAAAQGRTPTGGITAKSFSSARPIRALQVLAQFLLARQVAGFLT